MPTLRSGLACARRAAGLSQEDVAERVGVDRRTVQRWESGDVDPQPRARRALARALDVDLGALDDLLNTVEGPDSTEAVGDGDALDRLARVVAHPQRVDTETVDHLVRVLAEHRRVEDVLGAAPVLPVVDATVLMIESLVRDARPDVRPAVVRLLGEYQQFSGWMGEDVGDPSRALHHYDRALDAATETGDANMITSVWSLKSHLAWSTGNSRQAIGLARAGRRDVARVSPGVRSLIVQQEARGRAVLGEAGAVERLLDESEDLARRAAERPDDEPPWVYFAGPDRVLFQRGMAYLELGRYGKAGEMFERARRELPASYRRDLGRYTANIALAAAHQGELDRAVVEGRQAVALTMETSSSTTLATLRRMRAVLERHRPDVQVDGFDALILELGREHT